MSAALRLETPRFILRPPLKKDIPGFVKYLSHPAISKTTLHIPYPYTKADAVNWMNKNQEEMLMGASYTFVIVQKNTNQMIGAIGLHRNVEHNRAEAGYWIGVPYWNKGVATEVLIKMLEYGFEELGFHKIYATHLIENPASGRVMLKAGMSKEGKLKEHYKKGETYVTVIQYAVTASEFQKQVKKKNKNPHR